MMESPNGSISLTNKSDRDHLNIRVNLDQDPDPKIENVDITNENSSSTTTTTPAAYSPANRSKKSVRWSQDLVEERTLPPLEKGDDDYDSSNPYVNRSRESVNSTAFNMNS